MPITTYQIGEETFITNDKEINEWLPENYYVIKLEATRWVRKTKIFYGVVYDYAKTKEEYQIINFPSINKETSINTWVSKEVLLAFLMGLSNAIKYLDR